MSDLMFWMRMNLTCHKFSVSVSNKCIVIMVSLKFCRCNCFKCKIPVYSLYLMISILGSSSVNDKNCLMIKSCTLLNVFSQMIHFLWLRSFVYRSLTFQALYQTWNIIKTIALLLLCILPFSNFSFF